MIAEILTGTTQGVENWLILVFGMLLLAFLPVSDGLIRRARKSIGRSSITILLLILATLIYIYFREDMNFMILVDRIFYTILFAVVLLIMFIVWKWQGVKR